MLVEAWYEESIDIGPDVSGVVFMIGASYHELSRKAECDIPFRQCLSNDLSMSLTDIIVQYPDLTLRELCEMIYDRIFGSHPIIIAGNKTDLNIRVAEFFAV